MKRSTIVIAVCLGLTAIVLIVVRKPLVRILQGESALPAPAHDHAGAPDADTGAPEDIVYYTCPMHTFIRSPEPGQCPICSMVLTPVTREELTSGVLRIDDERRQLIGVKTSVVERRKVSRSIRAVGTVTWDETKLVDVSLQYRGWVRKLFVSRTGQWVRKGEPLFTLYAPELYTAQQELLAASTAGGGSAEPSPLLGAARERLRLWAVSDADIDRILAEGRPREALPIASPATGFVIEKDIVAGGTIDAGRRLYRIARLDRVWVEADVYESDLPLVHTGQSASVTLSYVPGFHETGTVIFVYPYLDPKTRTARVRIELPNPKEALKPDMFANVEIALDEREILAVPTSAVIYAGERRLVFLDLGEGRLQPVEVQIGSRYGDVYEVLDGLSEKAAVVTSGNFLVAAESRLKSATEKW